MEYCNDLISCLSGHSRTIGNSLALGFLSEGKHLNNTLTFTQLHQQAQAVAATLQAQGLAGQNVLLVYENSTDYVVAFMGCLYAGVVAVPLHPTGKNKPLTRIAAIAKDCHASYVLSNSTHYQELYHAFNQHDDLKTLQWLQLNTFDLTATNKWVRPNIKGSDTAFLQYTSGSTGSPKGVMVTHQNLWVYLSMADEAYTQWPGRAMVTWLPIHHDMGLILGVLYPIFTGMPCYLMTPWDFISNPYNWLHAISQYKATHTSAPNFAFEHCVNKITATQKQQLNFEALKIIFIAAEPVRHSTIERFTSAFAQCQFNLHTFKTGYGMAETTLGLAFARIDQPVLYRHFDESHIQQQQAVEVTGKAAAKTKCRTLVSHYSTFGDTVVKIANPDTFIEKAHGQVGEIWVKGGLIAKGYFNNPEATKNTFHAYMKDTGEGPFLRTGDLGFLYKGHLYISSRLKDLIIIRGQNHYPQDIEHSTETAHPMFRLGGAGATASRRWAAKPKRCSAARRATSCRCAR